ncbi:MAG: carbohydrate ABC transporter permease [Cellulomonas sp.]|uniref:carbohydrate ABC transporter permease n=1 Tax=Cellulomonas sp. 73-92 TaxID=1895740 RepID=UPI00092B914C|nr:carbohydrate ABC transporter permease [Cellulomonas sp. 73-92]MBN9375647.1 carbohydrate ABC transporter permease [Cellulomonas sp.]OJV78668.1 MAG: sugar ABC transporter permease [Cellulomonas sp. 73-92]
MTVNKVRSWIIGILLALGAIAVIVPIGVLFLSSFKTKASVFVISLAPDTFTIHSIVQALTPGLLHALLNSLIVSTAVTVVAMFLHAMAGYALARFDFPFKRATFVVILGSLMIPMTSILVPLYMVVRLMNMTNTMAGLIVPLLFNAYGIFLFRQFYFDFPKELEEAAELDGSGRFGTFLRIVLPLSRPVIVPLTVAFFLGTWNNYLWPLVVNQDKRFETVQVYLANQISGYNTPWNVVIASAAISVIPVFVLFFFLQRQLREGISTTGIK